MEKLIFAPIYKPALEMEWIARRPLSKDGSRGTAVVKQVTDAFFSDGLGFVGSQVIVEARTPGEELPFTAVYPLEAFYYLYEPNVAEEDQPEEEFALAT